MKRILTAIILVSGITVGVTLRAGNDEIARIHENSTFGPIVHFEKDGARFTFNPEMGVTIHVGNKYINIVRIGDNNSGRMIVRTNQKIIVVPYKSVDGNIPVFDANGNGSDGEEFISNFYASLGAQELVKIEALKFYMMNYIDKNLAKKSNYSQMAISDCDTFTMFSLTAFASCPYTGGLGCIVGVWGLYKEYKNC